MRPPGSVGSLIRTAVIIILITAASAHPQSLLSAGTGQTLTIYYTASLNGNLDGCDCKGEPKSGLVKTGRFLSLRDRSASVLIDAGDFLDPEPDEALAGYILDSFRELGYDAVGIGDQELSNGIAGLLPQEGENGLLCNNLRFKRGLGFRPFSPRPLLITVSGIRVGLFSVIHPETAVLVDPYITRKLRIGDPLAASAALEAELRAEGADLVVCIFHGSLEEARRLAQTVEGIDVILLGHEQRLVDAEKAGDTIIVSPGENGNRVGVLAVDLREGGIGGFTNRFVTFSYNASPDLPSIRTRIEEYYKLLSGRVRSAVSH